jgi:stage IV sporulation protein B
MMRLKKLCAVIILVLSLTLFSTSVKAQELEFYLGGDVLGFTIKTEGATVVGTCDVITKEGLKSPCKQAGIMVGDIILSLGSIAVNSANDVATVLDDYSSGEIVTKISRNGETILLDIVPALDVLGDYKLGVYLRDDLTGLGTVTFYRSDGTFGSLGHPVSDEKGSVYSVIGGDVYSSCIVGVNKATRGRAGELKGMFIGDKPIGSITKNTNVGLYGKINNFDKGTKTKIETAKAKQGKAKIYSTIDGISPKYYDIDIVKVDNLTSSNKNLVIKISDKELIKTTGGILQGMSGSPILQDGKLVGAVTHVFINDSSRGYGILIENMIKK